MLSGDGFLCPGFPPGGLSTRRTTGELVIRKVCVMRSFIGVLTAIGVGLVISAPVVAEYIEGWDTDPPANDAWNYYVEGGGQQGNGDVPLVWSATGGETGGYVQCPLAELTEWSEMPGLTNYWPFYTYGDDHAIDLNVNPRVQISLRDSSLDISSEAFDLGGGRLCFWIGEWTDEDGPGGTDADLSFFYLNLPLTTGPDWTVNVRDVRCADWVTIIDTQGKTAADLFESPQQWGIGIFGGAKPPSGALAFDTLSITVPEPGMLCLLMGGLLLMRRRCVS